MFMYICIFTNTHTHLCVFVFACVCMRARVHVCVCMYVRVCAGTHAHVRLCACDRTTATAAFLIFSALSLNACTRRRRWRSIARAFVACLCHLKSTSNVNLTNSKHHELSQTYRVVRIRRVSLPPEMSKH